VSARPPAAPIVLSLTLAVFLWGGNNVALKQMMNVWTPAWTGSTRFLVAGLLLLGLIRWTNWFGPIPPPSPALRRALWWRGGLLMATYIVLCNAALRFIPASHFALELALSPIWALLLEGGVLSTRDRLRRWTAAALAFSGVAILLWPSLRRNADSHWFGELLGLASGWFWTLHSRQGKALAEGWSGTAVAAHSMWRAGILLLPIALIELVVAGKLPSITPNLIGLQLYCIVLGGVIPFTLWNQCLARWPVSRVALFGNLIPGSTMAWAAALGFEHPSPTFGLAMAFIIAGVVVGQLNWERTFARFWMPEE
jgi:drug/metabolite transporter (DMT)-like permease